jgi:hypothetical protein
MFLRLLHSRQHLLSLPHTVFCLSAPQPLHCLLIQVLSQCHNPFLSCLLLGLPDLLLGLLLPAVLVGLLFDKRSVSGVRIGVRLQRTGSGVPIGQQSENSCSSHYSPLFTLCNRHPGALLAQKKGKDNKSLQTAAAGFEGG